MKITPFISGSGMAGKGMAKALGIISVINPDFHFKSHHTFSSSAIRA
jgi:hypothetical protein